MTIFKRHYLVQGRVTIWFKSGAFYKNANLDQTITIKICACTFFFKKSAETPIVIVLFDEQCF